MDYTIETDNRDLHETELLIMYGDISQGLHVEMTVAVDPIVLMENAIDNLPEDIAVSVRVLWDQFLEKMKTYTDVPFELDDIDWTR